MYNFPKISKKEISFLTVDQMILVDKLMIDTYDISLIQMMEHAWRWLALLCRERFLWWDCIGKKVCILAGTGWNGWWALVAARRLHIRWADVHVLTSKKLEMYSWVPKRQLDIISQMKIPHSSIEEGVSFLHADVILDGLIWYSLHWETRGDIASAIKQANESNIPICSLDTPSWLNLASAHISDQTIRASSTLTLALPKTWLIDPNAQSYVWDLYVADISVPMSIYDKLWVSASHIFSKSDIIRVW